MSLPRVLPALLVVLLAGACSSSDLELDDAAGTTSTSADVRASEPDAGDDERQGAIDLLASQGISEDGATCIVDTVIDEGVSVDELYQLGGIVVDPEIQEAFALASAACLDASDVADLPDEAFDLSNPIVRRQFVDSFSATSGLSREVSECVVDELIAVGFDARDAFGGASGELNEETLRQVTEAVESCA